MKTKNIKQEVLFSATPHEVYELLMDSKKHAKFTGSKAKIGREVGGKISAYDGYIEGTNLELVEDKKIVQKWRGSDWPEDHYSKASFILENKLFRKKLKQKATGGTKLIFFQEDVPEDQYQAISEGWKEHYWEPMKKMLEKK